MEPAKIDWKGIDSRFVEDVFFENIRAPKWYDFLDSEEDDSVDDEAWFCRPDCNHPKTAEDFLRTAYSSKHSRTGAENHLKRRGKLTAQPTSTAEDAENQNPNLSTPPNHEAKSWKGLFKSSTVKKKNTDQKIQNEEGPRLKSTLSARNLFAGKDIFSHITELCNELKKLATRTIDSENDTKLKEEICEVDDKNNNVSSDVLVEREIKEKERTPLLAVAKQKCEETDNGSSNKEKPRRKKRVYDAENIPISLNLNNIKHKEEERLLQVRINPPSPQCFSITRASNNTTPKSFRSNPKERGILQEVKLKNEVKRKEQNAEKSQKTASSSIVDAGESKGLDVFWFLKPCTMNV